MAAQCGGPLLSRARLLRVKRDAIGMRLPFLARARVLGLGALARKSPSWRAVTTYGVNT